VKKTIDDVLKIEDDADFYLTFSHFVDARCAQAGYENMTWPEKAIFAVRETDAEINNGGFDQFFSNLSGILAPDAYKAFLEIGAVELAALMKEAMTFFPDGALEDKNFSLEEFMDKKIDSSLDFFRPISDRYFDHQGSEAFQGFPALFRRYARANKDSFKSLDVPEPELTVPDETREQKLDAGATEAPSSSINPTDQGGQMHKDNVLVVENLRFVASMISTHLGTLGINCLIAANAKEAISMAGNKKFLAVFINPDAVESPADLNNLKDAVKAPAVIVSGAVSKERAEDLSRVMGIKEFLYKPFSPDDIFKIIRNIQGK
jgi:CheY-like chemotaxis protein